jgi:hypothetical protein
MQEAGEKGANIACGWVEMEVSTIMGWNLSGFGLAVRRRSAGAALCCDA